MTLFASLAQAADPPADYLADKPKAAAKKVYGWVPYLKTSGNISFTNSQDVVGQPDGSTWNIGYILSGGLSYMNKNGIEWVNTLGWQLNYLKTPLIEQFAKSMDNFEINSTFLYHLPKVKWMGPYGQFGLRTALFPGYMITATDAQVDYISTKGDITRTTNFLAQDRIDLTDAFAPTILKQSLGMFVKPLDKKQLKAYIQLGGGAWEIFGRNGWILADDAATPNLEVKALDDTIQMGAELNFTLEGAWKKVFTYGLKANFMMPVYTNSDSDLSGLDLLNMDFEVKAGVKVSKYVSVDYTFKAVKFPLISEKWQLINGLVISFNAALIEPPKEKAKPKAAADCKKIEADLLKMKTAKEHAEKQLKEVLQREREEMKKRLDEKKNKKPEPSTPATTTPVSEPVPPVKNEKQP